MNYKVEPIKNIINKRQTVQVPGSKSITARALLIAALANGTSTLYNVQFSQDCQTFLRCIKDLGIEVSVDGTTVKIVGCGGNLPKKKAQINVGSAGTAARFIMAFLAFCDGEYYIDSSEQMKVRPQAPLISALKNLGASFTFLQQQNSFPFIIKGTKKPKRELLVNIQKSSQYLSALLISAVCAPHPIKIMVEGQHGMDYVLMTQNLMRSFGANVQICGNEYTVNGAYYGGNYKIEPDISAACYFYAINKILGTQIQVDGVCKNSIQGDYKFIDLLQNFDGGDVDMSAFSDQALTLAAIAPYLKNPTKIYGISHIRGQECDRISAITTNLTAMGVEVEEFDDGVKIYPCTPHGAKINTFGDHRVAMAFAVAGTKTDGVEILNAEVCAKTFKEFFTVLDDLTKKITK